MKSLRQLFGTKRREHHNRKPRSLHVETLDPRRVFCNINLADGQLTVTGTNSADAVAVQLSSNPTATKVTANCGGLQQTKSFYGAVNNITFYGLNGNDNFTNATSIPSVLFGMSGHDTLSGGSGKDRVYGGNENDTLFGGGGNDSLYGHDGADILSGDAGNDGVYGGGGIDTLKGGSGADRFLTDAFNTDSVFDQTSVDARIQFNNGGSTLSNGMLYSAKSWTQFEIESVDAALRVMHETAADSHLLKKADGTPMTFVRRGASAAPSNVLGWNSSGNMTILDKAFDGTGGMALNQVVYHEVGHNWDSVVSQAQFDAISNWMAFPTNLAVPSGFERAKDSNGVPQPWIFSASATFARPYGKTNPDEDFATAFAAYFMNKEGKPYAGGPGAAAIPAKIAYIDTFIV